MKSFYKKYEFWIFFGITFLVIYFGILSYQQVNGAFIYSSGGNATTTQLSTTQPQNSFYRIASSSVPSPIPPFTLGKIKIKMVESNDTFEPSTLLKIIINGNDKGYRPLIKEDFSDSFIGAGSLTYNTYNYSADFSTSSITINPLDNFEIIINHGNGSNAYLKSLTYLTSNEGPGAPTIFDIYSSNPFYSFDNSNQSYPDSKTFINPFNNQTLTSDFNNWQISYTNNSSSTKNLSFSIYWNQKTYYEANLGMIVDNFSPNLIPYATGTTSIYIPKSQSLFASTTYIAWINIYDGTTNTTSTPIYFVTSPSIYVVPQPFTENPFNVNSTSTNWFDLINATSSPFFVDCSTYADTGFFSAATMQMLGCQGQKLLFQLAGMLMITPPSIQNYLDGSLQKIQTIFPFSLYASLTNSLKTAINQISTSTNTLALEGDIQGYKFDVPIFTTSTLTDLIGATTTDTIFTGVRSILWIMTGLAIIGLI